MGEKLSQNLKFILVLVSIEIYMWYPGGQRHYMALDEKLKDSLVFILLALAFKLIFDLILGLARKKSN